MEKRTNALGKNPPKSTEEVASVNRLMSIGDENRSLLKKKQLFHCLRKDIHKLSLSRLELLRRMESFKPCTELASWKR